MTQPAVRFDHVGKRFLGVQALNDVSLEVAEGSCHALCGENGAGKSTLGKIVAGIHTADTGRLFIHGRPASFVSPRDALQAGVGMVHQELAYVDRGVVPVLLAQPVYKWGYVGVQTIVDKVHLKKVVPPIIPMELVRVTKASLGDWARQLEAWGFTDVDPKYLKM